MAGRHWLDPLARRLLVAAGQLPPPPRVAPIALAGAADETVERELLALKLAHNPRLRLRDAAEVHHAAALGWTLEVNVAAAGDWLRLPGCRPDQVDRLIRLRRDGVQWSGPGELARALQVPHEQVLIWLPVLRFARHGELGLGQVPVPLAINQASEGLLRERLGLGPERCRRLLRERAREPFRDLADLQQRLQLPPEMAERWIGRFRYAATPGPVLPPSGRPAP
ncbi:MULTISPECIES: hypothetical protein [unclassified Cyanobium]|uniref:hypothetical protein n=1 Tax=unclassified Cyanobium TaxID=2627006 RepID=UPI0020CC7817|nr:MULTISPECIES: hypothetical protein [unclassified Cyanobium]MCP9833449.1 hypothetical protein [Cyanobium sp. La Preciosa 7G6]MCP9936214.1 hypothetical protein [Cyanobium sp. Aljojuca 7A6]